MFMGPSGKTTCKFIINEVRKSAAIHPEEQQGALTFLHSFSGAPRPGNRLVCLRPFVGMGFAATWTGHNFGIAFLHLVQKLRKCLATILARPIKLLIVRHGYGRPSAKQF